MKTKTTITDITKEDLVNLISTACYGSMWLDFQYDRNVCEDVLPTDCAEDIAAKILLAGGPVEFVDNAAEFPEEVYSETGYFEQDAAVYPTTLSDIRRGLEGAYNGTFKNAEMEDCEYIRHCIGLLCNEPEIFDDSHAELLMQIILFNEVIY